MYEVQITRQEFDTMKQGRKRKCMREEGYYFSKEEIEEEAEISQVSAGQEASVGHDGSILPLNIRSDDPSEVVMSSEELDQIRQQVAEDFSHLSATDPNRHSLIDSSSFKESSSMQVESAI